jgi:HlyD family secretion protein
MNQKYLIPLIFILLAGAAFFVYETWIKEEPLPDGLLQANGRIEGDHITIASKFAGRVEQLPVEEGDSVEAGQILVVIEDKQINAQVEQAQREIESIASEISAEEILLGALNRKVDLEIEIAREDVSKANAAYRSKMAAEDNARKDAERYQQLAAVESVPETRKEDATLAWIRAREALESASRSLTQSQQRYEESELGKDDLSARENKIDSLKSKLLKARAAVKEVSSILSDLTIVAPTDGVITTKLVEMGEVINPGTPLLDLVNLDRLYLKVYIQEKEIGKLSLGLSARIYTDAFPDKYYPATLRYIASKAEFTPKEVQTPEERVKLVYAVKLYLDENPSHQLTPGLPADAVIRWEENTSWQKPRW